MARGRKQAGGDYEAGHAVRSQARSRLRLGARARKKLGMPTTRASMTLRRR